MILENHRDRIISCIFLALFLFASGCAPKTTIVLLPDPSGKVGHVTVSTDAGSTDITKAREATVASGRRSLPTTPKILSEKEITTQFSPVLAILPEQPVHFILYFENESTELKAASEKIIPEILESITNRNSQRISVIGHSDTAGDPQFNLQLSEKRAQAVRRIIIDNGVDESYITSTSHGEENPLIPTDDNVHEPKNRRVEVVVQ